MKLRDIYRTHIASQKTPVISFEVFPPQNSWETLDKELTILKKYNPALISVTSTSSATNCEQNKLVQNIQNTLQVSVMPHLTCMRNTRKDVEEYLTVLKDAQTDCILALRGDYPSDGTSPCTDFRYANELVEFIKSKSYISIGVAGYPEGHIESPNINEDINNLKKKLDAGADVIYTQLFYDDTKFFKYTELVRKAGITAPIIAGIMPILSYKQIKKMTTLANISVPDKIAEKIELYKDDTASMHEFGIETAVNQCRSLIESGICGLHFYTLNKSYSVSKILDNIL